MTPLPTGLGGGPEIIGWRLDRDSYAPTWSTGEGAFQVGGRWNSKGVRAVYASLDPATAVLEVAVHKTFKTLDTVPHVLTWFEILDPARVKVVTAANVPNTNWLRPGAPSAGQQQFGDAILQSGKFMVVPSAVSTHSWNVTFIADLVRGDFRALNQEAFALDTRLHPP